MSFTLLQDMHERPLLYSTVTVSLGMLQIRTEPPDSQIVQILFTTLILAEDVDECKLIPRRWQGFILGPCRSTRVGRVVDLNSCRRRLAASVGVGQSSASVSMSRQSA